MIIQTGGRKWEVFLEDDGTLDTVVSARPVRGNHESQDARFDLEYASQYRLDTGEMTPHGLRELGLEAIEAYQFENGEDE